MSSPATPNICIVIPVHNEQDNIGPLTKRIIAVIEPLRKYKFGILFVDDGSSDNTLNNIKREASHNLSIGYIQLSRNFGHQAALEAGLAFAPADAIITMDGDLQHPPEEIPRMLTEFEAGADVIQMQRKNVSQDFKGMLSLSFYTFFKWISETPLVPNAADFRLVSRRVVEEIMRVPGKGKLLRAQIPSIGFKQVHLEYQQDDRKFGKPSYSFFASYELALHTIFKFSRFPAHFTSALGVLLLLSGILLYVLNVTDTIANNRQNFFLPFFIMLGGCVFLATSIICWYLYFILEQVRHDPSYVVKEIVLPRTPA